MTRRVRQRSGRVGGIRGLVVCLLLVVGSLDVCAQTASTGALTGTVIDPTGGVLRSTRITLRNKDTAETRIAITDQYGGYRFSLLPPGAYELTFEAVGFAPLTLREILIRITEVRSLATQLVVADLKEDVVVQVPLLQSDNVALGRVITRETIEALPLVNRNYTQILGLTGGTNTNVVDATLLGAGSQELRANGARSSDNNFMLNGVDGNSYGGNMTEATNNSGGGLAIPAPDSIEEFKVQNSLYDAQYGRGGGANVLVETKSGTAQFHGNIYYFGRNDALNANNFFANATGIPKGEFTRHQPGATLGGPLPWLAKGDNFFVSYQATRDVNAASLTSSVRSLSLPSIPSVRTPASFGATFGGQTGLFGGVSIAPDGSNINPVALNLLNAKNPDGSFVIPGPQIGGTDVNYTAVVPGHYDEDQFNTNIALNLSTSNRLSVKFFFSNSSLDVPFSGASVPGFPALRDFDNRNLAIADSHVFSPRAVNQFRFGFSRIASRSAAPSSLTAQSVGMTRANDPTERSLPHIQILGAFQIGNAANDKNETTNNNFYVSDTISWSRDKHSFRFGVEIFQNQFKNGPDNTDGSILFLSLPDFLLGLPGGEVSARGNGTPLSNVYLASNSATVPHTDLRSTAAHVFATDDWKISTGLTINLGFRLEINGQQSDAHGQIANFDPAFYVAPPPGGFSNPNTSGFVLPDNYEGPAPDEYPHTNATLVQHPVQLHPEPRIGLAWVPSASREIVVRAGYGLYTDRISFFGSSVDLVHLVHLKDTLRLDHENLVRVLVVERQHVDLPDIVRETDAGFELKPVSAQERADLAVEGELARADHVVSGGL